MCRRWAPKPDILYLHQKAFSELCVCLAWYTASQDPWAHISQENRGSPEVWILRERKLSEAVNSVDHVLTEAPNQTIQVASSGFAPFDKILNTWQGLGPGGAGHRVIIRKNDEHLTSRCPTWGNPKLEPQFPNSMPWGKSIQSIVILSSLTW